MEHVYDVHHSGYVNCFSVQGIISMIVPAVVAMLFFLLGLKTCGRECNSSDTNADNKGYRTRLQRIASRHFPLPNNVASVLC
jgi:hypothetical protein